MIQLLHQLDQLAINDDFKLRSRLIPWLLLGFNLQTLVIQTLEVNAKFK